MLTELQNKLQELSKEYPSRNSDIEIVYQDIEEAIADIESIE